MPLQTISAHSLDNTKNDTVKSETGKIRLKHVFDRSVGIVLFSGRQETVPQMFTALPVHKCNDNKTIGYASNFDVDESITTHTLQRAELLVAQLFESESFTNVCSWLKLIDGKNVAAFTVSEKKYGVICWQATRAELDTCPGGYVSLVCSYIAALLVAYSEISVDVNCKFVGRLPFTSLEEYACAQRECLKYGIILFNQGKAQSRISKPQLMSTNPLNTGCLCFAVSSSCTDAAGLLLQKEDLNSEFSCFSDTPVYLTIGYSWLHDIAHWIIAFGFSVLISTIVVGLCMST